MNKPGLDIPGLKIISVQEFLGKESYTQKNKPGHKLVTKMLDWFTMDRLTHVPDK